MQIAPLCVCVSIGKYAFVGAGAMVNKDVPDYALVVGIPAKQIGWMSEYGEQLEFSSDTNGTATCKQTGDKYIISSNIC